MNDSVSRRAFMRDATVLAGGSGLVGAGLAAAPLAGIPTVHAGGGPIRIALVGCGKRGTGAIEQIMNSPHPTQLVAMADAFQDQVDWSYARLQKKYAKKLAVPTGQRFAGFDAFKHAIDTDGVDLVVLATPPGFRPPHLAYAVEKKKHVFMEKPVAVDAAGVNSVLESTKRAKERNLMLAVGLQRRHEPQYMETVQRIQDGQIGDVLYARAFWNGGGVWNRPRKEGMTEMEYQMRNWYYFVWLCGDHIVEQHIHNLDVINWVKGGFPVKANGQGGREVRTGKEFGEIFDHHFVEFEYADGSRMYSQCRHIKGCDRNISEHVYGTKGKCLAIGQAAIEGEKPWKFRGRRLRGHQQEQLDLIDALVKGEVYNEGEYGAMSTMTSILGRLATYSGKEVSMAAALKSSIGTMPSKLAWNANPPSLPGEDGHYTIAVPGKTKVV